jgi:hypothetical protein
MTFAMVLIPSPLVVEGRRPGAEELIGRHLVLINQG